jgi:hypothetical protein
MADVLFLLITAAFFLLAVGAVRLCDRIIGTDAEHLPAPSGGAAAEPAEAVR